VNDKHPEAAIARVQGLIARFPQRSDLYDQLAELQRYTKDLPGALTSAETAMKLNPSDTDAIVAYTRVQIASGNAPKAIATWQQWTKDHPKDAQADIVLGSLLETQGDRDKAIDSYKKALQIQPDQPIAANNLAYLMVEAGQNIDVALSLAQTARRGLPNSPSTADTLAWAYFHKESYLSARDLLEEALKTAPDDPALHYHLGLTYSKLSDKPNALLHLKKAVTLGPDTPVGKEAQTALTSLS
jgi:tetratricopeptide (TPR) repeat protein